MTTARSPQETGAIIQDRRIRLKLTQDELAGVSPATVRKLETGAADSFSKATLVAVAEALGWPADFYAQLRDGVDPSDLDRQATASAPPPGLADGAEDRILKAIAAGAVSWWEPALAALQAIEVRLDRIEQRLGIALPELEAPHDSEAAER